MKIPVDLFHILQYERGPEITDLKHIWRVFDCKSVISLKLLITRAFLRQSNQYNK